MDGDDAQAQAQASLDARLEEFLERLTPGLGRPDRRRRARTYVAGLLLDGERKSVQPLAGRLGATDNGQALHHFVAPQSPRSSLRAYIMQPFVMLASSDIILSFYERDTCDINKLSCNGHEWTEASL